MEIKMNIKALILFFLLSACTGESDGFYGNIFEPCDNVKFERVRDYPNELDSLIRNELSNNGTNKFTLDSMIVHHTIKQSNCEIDSTQYGAQVYISKNNSSQIWSFYIGKRDWIVFDKERVK